MKQHLHSITKDEDSLRVLLVRVWHKHHRFNSMRFDVRNDLLRFVVRLLRFLLLAWLSGMSTLEFAADSDV